MNAQWNIRTYILCGLGLWVAFQLAGCKYYRTEFRLRKFAPSQFLVVPGFELLPNGSERAVLYNRVVMAKLLLDCGYADAVLFSGGVPKAGITEAERMLDLAVELGIPKQKIVLEPEAESSVQNAWLSARILQSLGAKSALVVTDPLHLAYAIPVFKDAFAHHGIRLAWTPVDYRLLQKSGLGRMPQRFSGDVPGNE